MRNLLVAVLLLVIVPCICTVDVFATTLYVAANGSDSNAGTAKSAPWAHLPGMPTCAGACASYKPQPGDRFILRGGDTWAATNLGVEWTWDGTSGSRIYIGVDKTWYSGVAWTRPAFSCGGNSHCGGNTNSAVIDIVGNYVSVDNIEITGMYLDTSNAFMVGIRVQKLSDEVENCYLHNANHAAGASPPGPTAFITAYTGNGEAAVAGASFHDNVIDNSDGDRNHWYGILHGDKVANNVVRYVTQAIQGEFNDIHGNLVEYIGTDYTGDHCNMVLHYGPLSGSASTFYNNVVRHQQCSGGVTVWVTALTSCSGCTTNVFNNVIYDDDISSGEAITIGGHPTYGNTGSYNVFNNTIEAGPAPCIGNTESSPRSTTNYSNNQCITTNSICANAGTTCADGGGNLTRTPTQAATDGYVATGTYAYAPPAGGNTIGAGVNQTASCSALGTALCSDTTYAVGYDTVNHAVNNPGSTPLARSSSSAWDIGAYLYSAQAQTQPNPPSNLAVSVQ